MKAYRICFVIATALISLPLGAALWIQILASNPQGVALFSAALVLMGCVAWAVYRQWRFAFAGSLALAALLWLPLALQTLSRIAFMLKHGGMDCANCEASPLAFLVGMLLEQWIFLPLTAVLLTGARHIWRTRATPLPHTER